MFKFTVYFTNGGQLEVHFNAGKDALWIKTLSSFKQGVLEVLFCEKEQEYIKINWNNVSYVKRNIEEKKEKPISSYKKVKK